MDNPIKITQQELDKINSIRTSYETITVEMGQLEIETLDLQERLKDIETAKSKLVERLRATQVDENATINQITQKYGEGKLNLKDGTFTKE